MCRVMGTCAAVGLSSWCCSIRQGDFENLGRMIKVLIWELGVSKMPLLQLFASFKSRDPPNAIWVRKASVFPIQQVSIFFALLYTRPCGTSP